MQYDSGMGFPAVLAAVRYDFFSAEFWKNLPAIAKEARDNPLGVAAIVFIVGALAVLTLAATGSEKFKRFAAAGIMVLVLAVSGFLYAGNSQLGKTHDATTSVSGRVIDRDTGRPIPRASVSLASKGVPLTTLTNSDGYWVVDNLNVPAGTHLKISVDATGYQSRQTDVSADAAATPPDIALDPVVQSKKDTGGKRTTGRDSGVDSSLVTLQGTVFTRTRAPVFGADIIVESSDPPRRRTTTSLTDGSFTVTKVLVRPDLKITVRAPGYKPAVRGIRKDDVNQLIEIPLDSETGK